MCNASASSTIATQEVKWGNKAAERYLGSDWTRDELVWNNFKQQILEIPKLNNIHFMGGETLLTNRFEDFVDAMIKARRFDLCFSFVTNGTTFKPALIKKLTKFRRVGIEISIETLTDHNAYQRQGTKTNLVLKNIEQYLEYCNNTSITVSLRPALSALTIGNYDTLLNYALTNKLLIKNNLVYEPKFLSATILPQEIKRGYSQKYMMLLNKLKDVSTESDYNYSDPNNYQSVVKQQVEMCLILLNKPRPDDADELVEQMIRHCERWDQVYGLDARLLYPEFHNIFRVYDYNIS
jgi:hypothetical protein